MRSLEGSQTPALTSVTSACQCHQGASIFHSGTSSPVALRSTSPPSPLVPPPRPPCLLVLEASVTHLSLLSSTPALPPIFLPWLLQEGNHRSENGDHFVPVSGLVVKGGVVRVKGGFGDFLDVSFSICNRNSLISFA